MRQRLWTALVRAPTMLASFGSCCTTQIGCAQGKTMTQLSYGHFGCGWMFQPRPTSARGGESGVGESSEMKTFEANLPP